MIRTSDITIATASASSYDHWFWAVGPFVGLLALVCLTAATFAYTRHRKIHGNVRSVVHESAILGATTLSITYTVAAIIAIY